MYSSEQLPQDKSNPVSLHEQSLISLNFERQKSQQFSIDVSPDPVRSKS
jgi:hypothetical protein